MIQKNIHGSSRSPIKKQLAKRIVSYFDQLEDARKKERSIDRSASRSRSRSASKRSIFEVERNIEHYQDVDIRQQKLEDLKELMKRELLKAKKEGATDVHPDEVYHSVHGYPSFMKTDKTPKQYRKSPTRDTNLQAFKKSIHRLLEERVLKTHGSKDPEDESVDLTQLQNETQELEEHHRSTLRSHSRSPGRSPGSTWKGPNLYDDILYSLETSKLVVPNNAVDDHNYDFHQRKSKEIRRLQYVNGWRDRQKSKPRVPLDHREEHQKEGKVFTGKDRPEVQRSPPSEGYPVWVRLMINGIRKEVPAVLHNKEGFKINPTTDTMEVIEKDKVTVSPYENAPSYEIFTAINGIVERPNPRQTAFEEECELVVQETNGKRHPVLFYLREPVSHHVVAEPIKEESDGHRSGNFDISELIPQPQPPNPSMLYKSEIAEPQEQQPKSRVMEDANIRAFDTNGKFLGRGKLTLERYDKISGEPIKYAKGILLNSDEKIEFVLAKFTGDNSVSLKRQNLTHTHHNIDDQEDMDLGGYKVKMMTLAEKGPKATPQLLFIMDGEHHIQKDKLLEGEEGSVELEDYSRFDGILQYESVPDDREGNLWLLVTSPHFDSSLSKPTAAANKQSSALTSTFGPKGSAIALPDSMMNDRIRLELDDSDPERDISNLLDSIKAILDMRKPPPTPVTPPPPAPVPPPTQLSQVVPQLATSTQTIQNDSQVIEKRRTSDLNRDDTLDLIVICPGGHRLRIYVRPKGHAEELDNEVEATFGAPQFADNLMRLQFGEQNFDPDGIRVLKHPLHQRPRQLDKFDVRVVQFTDPQTMQSDHDSRMAQLEEEEREKQRLLLEEQLRQAEEDERVRRLKEEEQRLHALRLEEERKHELERARRLKEEEDRLKRLRQEEEARAREEDERVRKAAEEVERVRLLKEQEERRRAEEEERLRRQQEEEDRLRRQREEEERLRKLREEEEKRRLEAEEAERKRIQLEQEAQRLREENEKKRREAEEAERKRREEEDEARRLRESLERRRIEAEAAERRRLEEEEARRLRESMERKRIEAEEAERKRLQAEEEARRLRESMERKKKEEEERKAREAEERKRIELEEQARRKREADEEARRKKMEAEEAERKRLQDEEDARRKREAELEAKRLHDELERKRKEAEEAERRRREAEEETRRLQQSIERKRLLAEEEARKKREADEAERRRREEEEARRLKASQDRRRQEDEARHQREEEERLRLLREQEEIEATQRKVRELKEALERSRLESSQDLHVIKKTTDSISKRYQGASNSSLEESEPSRKKEEIARLTRKDGQEVEYRASKTSSKPSSKALSKTASNLAGSQVQVDKSKKSTDQGVKSIKYDPKRKSEHHQYSTQKETHTTTKRTHESELIMREGSYTKIELNLENSQDDIDFIGYGTMRVNQKKSRSPSPELKTKFLKISPARDIPAEFEKDYLMTTKAFTPRSTTYMSHKKEMVTSKKEVTSSTKKSQSRHQEIPMYESMAPVETREDNVKFILTLGSCCDTDKLALPKF